MKKKVMSIFMFMFILISISLICATEEEQIDRAYTCIEGRIVSNNCSTGFSFEDKIYSFLATENLKCQKEVMKENLSTSTSLCWPKTGCTLKSTAQAVLALNENINTTKAEKWLLEQSTTPTEMDWFLEIEGSNDLTSCAITYSDSSYNILISEDKKISSSNLGTGLTLAQDNYWLKISQTLYNKDIYVSCNNSFITTLLFKKKDSSTLHISEIVHSSAANGRTTEKVDSFCFSQGGTCNYEGSLWAAFVLYTLDYDISKFLPYLITMMDEESNQIYIPESFLYFITGKFDVDLLLKQKAGLYWEESGNKYFDTALALWPLYYESSSEKENSKSWLLNIQQESGCWNNGNLKDTAFILYSIWPKSPPNIYSECFYDNNCPQYTCQEASCDNGVCFYSALTSGICGEEYGCNSDSDCDEYASETDEYCSSDETKIYRNVSNWECESSVCVEYENPELVKTCYSDEECYAGNCLNINEIPSECSTSYDCVGEEICVGGYCNLEDCEEEGYFCMSQTNCEGNTLSGYSCTGLFECCDTEISLNTCLEEGGEICDSDEACSEDGTTKEVSDTAYGESCCVNGECEEEIISDCEDNDGICKSSCGDNEEENSDYSCDYGESCCVSNSNSNSNYLWIWILLVLILLSVLGIVFRNNLRTQWLKFKTLFGGKKDKKRFEMPSTSSSNSLGRIFSPQRVSPTHKPLPPHSSVRKPEGKSKSEIDDVLKKLKEMSK